MRILLLVLTLVLGCCAERVQGQTLAQNMTFSVVCLYVTNTYSTNLTTGTINQDQHLYTVLLSSANIIKAIVVDTFWTNNWTTWASNLARWQGGYLVYEENMTTGNQGIFLRYAGRQINVSHFFTNSFSTNGYANMFAQDAPKVFGGTIYPPISTNGYANILSSAASNDFDMTIHPDNSLPLTGGFGYLGNGGANSNNYFNYDNLAYLTFTSSNTSFTLFGYSQGTLLRAAYDNEGDIGKADKAEITGAGTFSLNLTDNILRLTNGFTIYTNLTATEVIGGAYVNTLLVPATNYVGLTHGTIYVGTPYRLVGLTNGP